MVALNTIHQSQITLVHPNDPKNTLHPKLVPFTLIVSGEGNYDDDNEVTQFNKFQTANTDANLGEKEAEVSRLQVEMHYGINYRSIWLYSLAARLLSSFHSCEDHQQRSELFQ